MKLPVAAYYSTATAWSKPVTISGKGNDFPAGATAILSAGRILPRGIKDFAWQVDDPIGEKFGYNTNIKNYKPAGC